MSPLVKIRSERDSMSAVERRIADFILENALLLRDYSSQQLANALGISQSSVVKFTQKLGFRGYPDLKYSVGEAIARDNGDADNVATAADASDDPPGTVLWRRKNEAEEATRLINSRETVERTVQAIDAAGRSGKVFIIGLGEDDIYARGFALKLSLLGILAIYQFDAARMAANISTAQPGDVLLAFSEHGKHPGLCKIARFFHERRGQVITVTRHTSNPLRALADIALVVSAHDDLPYIQSLVYQSSLQHLLDTVFVSLCESDDTRHAQLVANLDRIQQTLDS
ncbi:RpiR family transcriptional regulator [Luteibacter rhizovicinus]|uniref:RpiR family transcriptional regulator n=1 Tax=Luteibacter rhizovicinus TaxID=242606 RepID=A0A4R3YQK1_9GAMM|nr:MurR/RpiR family transcriptional regulator [Luteibacter rhizovicinus]TCV93898.1 RpiR family transcriptional regulator [Luteibacter rhizovicinus]